MRAAVYHRYGHPDVVNVVELPDPLPAKHEFLIRVRYSTVNRTDTGFRSAEYVVSRLFSGLLRPKFPVLGNEFAGEVVAVGGDVRRFHIGDRVFGYNDERFGAHAEFMLVRETDAVAIIPEDLSFADAVALTEGAHYALCDLRAAKVAAGQEILINGGTGAIGSAAIQLCRFYGCHVTAVCHGVNVHRLKTLGADVVIDLDREDFTNLNRQFDFVFDAVGKSTFGKCKVLLKPGGKYISTELGPGGQNIFLALWTPFFSDKKLLFPIPTISREDVEFLRDLAAKKQLIPLIDRTFSLNQIVEAHRYAQSGQKIGNVLISIP